MGLPLRCRVMRQCLNVAIRSRHASASPKPLQSRPDWDCWGDSLFEEVGCIGCGLRALGACVIHVSSDVTSLLEFAVCCLNSHCMFAPHRRLPTMWLPCCAACRMLPAWPRC